MSFWRAMKTSLDPRQLRAARALIEISRAALADAAGVTEITIKRFESGRAVSRATEAALMSALDALNVVIFEPDTAVDGRELSIAIGLRRMPKAVDVTPTHLRDDDIDRS